jgi:ankyrin repeat protein
MNRIMGGRKGRLLSAIEFGQLQLVKDLVARGAEVNPLTGKKHWMSIPVMWAAFFGSTDILRFLVEDAGADVNITDVDGKTALMKSSEYANLEVMRFLVEHGADVNATDEGGITALISAFTWEKNVEPVVRYLCLHGADPNIIDKYGKKAIDYAKYNRNYMTLRNILLEGCPPMKSTYTSTEGGYRRRSKTKRNHHRNKQTKRIARK